MTAMRRGDPPMCDNAAPTRPSRRSVEPALKLLWEASTPDERHQRLYPVRQDRRRDDRGTERRRVDPGRRRVRLRAVRYPALRLGDQAAATVDPDDARQAGGAAGARRRDLAYQICFALDAGARGVVVPMVNTRAEAEA